MKKDWGCNPWVFQPWRVSHQHDLFTCKDTGLLDRLGGVELVSGLQKGF